MPYLMGAFKERKMFVFFHQAKSLQLIKLNSNTFKSIEDNFQLRAHFISTIDVLSKV